MLTGRNPTRSGVFAPNYTTRPEEITIARVLKSAGYRTGHFGKWHVGAVKAASPTNPAKMGFDEYLSHDNFFELNPSLSRNGGPPELFKGESSEILIDDPNTFNEVQELLNIFSSKQGQTAKLYQGEKPLFSKFQLEEQIGSIFENRVRLKSGASIVIEPTEALVTINLRGKARES